MTIQKNTKLVGSLEECLAHFRVAKKVKSDIAREMAAWIHVPVSTVHKWLYKNPRAPIYLERIKLMYYLHTEKQYIVRELAELPDTLYKVGYAIATGTHSIIEVAEAFHVRERTLVHAFTGGGCRFFLNKLDLVTKFVPQENTTHTFFTLNGGNSTEQVISLIDKMFPLVAHLASDKCSADERRTFREHVGSERLFELAANMYKLCGERSRNSLLHGEKANHQREE